MKTKHKEWRRGWDSNPRDPFGPNGFQDESCGLGAFVFSRLAYAVVGGDRVFGASGGASVK
jgi:hypothetical protein